MKAEYSDIAAYEPEDFKGVVSRLVEDSSFREMIDIVATQLFNGKMSGEQLKETFAHLNDVNEMDAVITFPGLKRLAELTSAGMELSGKEQLTTNALYITNHRDIILDAAFLSVMVKEEIGSRFYMGIGTNLYIAPWIEDLVRLHLCFNIIRGGSPRELLSHSTHLSDYIHYLLTERHASAWIAQREGRAKDSNDLTQPALLKMLTMSGEGSFIEKLRALNVTPVSLSYEYDPCDYLKAQEMQCKRDDAGFKKTPQDDYLNMRTGITGYKGRIRFALTPCINNELKDIEDATPIRNLQVELAAKLIDKHIHANYTIFPNNMVAYDLLEDSHRFRGEYTQEDKERFETYIARQIDKIELPKKDTAFLRERLLEMYANPLRNKLKATEDIIL